MMDQNKRMVGMRPLEYTTGEEVVVVEWRVSDWTCELPNYSKGKFWWGIVEEVKAKGSCIGGSVQRPLSPSCHMIPII